MLKINIFLCIIHKIMLYLHKKTTHHYTYCTMACGNQFIISINSCSKTYVLIMFNQSKIKFFYLLLLIKRAKPISPKPITPKIVALVPPVFGNAVFP